MATDNGNILSSTNTTSLSFTTNGKTSSDESSILKTDYRSNLTIDTPTPSIWDNPTDIYNRSISQDNPISANITEFDSNTGEYTVEYTWNNHNNPDPAYYRGNLNVDPDTSLNISVNGGTKNILVDDIAYYGPSNLTINRYCPVTLSGTIPADFATYNQGGSISDNNFYSYVLPFRTGGIIKFRTVYGPAQEAGSVNDLSGVLTLTSDSSWLTFDNGTTEEKYEFSNKENKFPSITVNATTNTPNAKYGTASASLNYGPMSMLAYSSSLHKITLYGLSKLTDADNTNATSEERIANISYSFHINNWQNRTADGAMMRDITDENITGGFKFTQDGGDVSVPNPSIKYSLTYDSADYTVPGDKFTPTYINTSHIDEMLYGPNSATYNITFGSIEGKEGEVSGNVSANFPDSFESYGGTANVTVDGLTLTDPVNYGAREVKFNAVGKIDYVDKVNDSTTDIKDHTYTTSMKISIVQGGNIHDNPEAEIQWYIDSAKTNAIPSGLSSAPSLSISSNPMSLGASNKTISLTATSNEALPKSGGVTGDLQVTKDKTSVPSTGGTVTITCDPSNLIFTIGSTPSTDSAYFRVRGYSTLNTKGIDNITTVVEDDFDKDFSDAIAGSGNLVYNKLIYIKGKQGFVNSIPSCTVNFSSTAGTVNPTSLKFSALGLGSTSTKQVNWEIPWADSPNTSLAYEMAADNKSVNISMSGSNLSASTFKFTYNYNGKSNSFTVDREERIQHINTTLSASGDIAYLNTNGLSFPMTYSAQVGDTYTFSGWSFKNDTRNYKVDSVRWDSNTLEYSSTGTESSQNAVLNISTSLEDYTPKTVTFTLTGYKQSWDTSGITEYSKSWVTNIPVIINQTLAAPIISVTPTDYENYFTYTWDGASKFTGTFKAVQTNGSSLAISTPDYNTNGWNKYFAVNYSSASGGDVERNVTITAETGGKSATLTCHRPAVTIAPSSATTITFNVTNNDPDFVTLACSSKSINPNNSESVYPTSTEKDLSTISLDKFDNYTSVFTNQGANKSLAPITTNITTTDNSGNPQLGETDAGTYNFYSGFNSSDLSQSINLTKTATGQAVCVQDTTKSSNYSKEFTRNISVSDIINNSNPSHTWSITNNSGAGFLSIDNSGILTINSSNYNVTDANGVNETVTYTMNFGSPAKEYFGKDTLSITKTLHVDGNAKYYLHLIPYAFAAYYQDPLIGQTTKLYTGIKPFLTTSTDTPTSNEFDFTLNNEITVKTALQAKFNNITFDFRQEGVNEYGDQIDSETYKDNDYKTVSDDVIIPVGFNSSESKTPTSVGEDSVTYICNADEYNGIDEYNYVLTNDENITVTLKNGVTRKIEKIIMEQPEGKNIDKNYDYLNRFIVRVDNNTIKNTSWQPLRVYGGINDYADDFQFTYYEGVGSIQNIAIGYCGPVIISGKYPIDSQYENDAYTYTFNSDGYYQGFVLDPANKFKVQYPKPL